MNELIVAQSSNGDALSAEHYQTFEMAKANDSVLGGDDIAQIRSYAAYARAQAQAIHKTIAATNGIDDVAAIKAEATETAQTFAKVGIYADQRIGEILRELPTAKAGRKANEVDTPTQLTKGEAVKQSNIDHHTAIDLQKIAANPEVVEAVIAKAEKDGRVVSRAQVLKEIKKHDEAVRQEKQLLASQRDAAIQSFEELALDNENMETEIASLKRQLSERPKPEVIEREVEVVREVESQESQARIRELEHLERIHHEDTQKLRKRNEELRKELDRARDILGLDKTTREIQHDVQYLITATNQYVRHYGGLTWTVQSLSEVDEPTIEELHKAVRNLATFANTLMNCLEEING